jgi:prevent-host-death family protein
MKIASVADVKAHLSAYLKASAQGPVVVTRNGKAVAVLVAVGDDEDLERLLMAHSPKLQAILSAARQRIQEGKGIPHEQFWERVEKNSGSAKGKTKGGKTKGIGSRIEGKPGRTTRSSRRRPHY